VGNFLVVIPGSGLSGEAKRLFLSSLDAAREIRSQIPSDTWESDWGFAASFPRQNGSGAGIVSDPATGSWLLAIGTWFHCDDRASGAESYLLNRYLEVGAFQLGRELEGFFVLLIGDARIREVIAITDIVGSCHCFRRTVHEGIILSGSSLLLASSGDCTVDWVGCQEFLDTGIIYEERTCYQEVRKLGPARIYRFSDTARGTEQKYWQAADVKPQSSRADDAVNSLWQKLTLAAARIHRLYPHSVCDLTGGYDSRALVAAFLGANVRCATTVSGPSNSADVVISQGLAQVLGLRHLHSEPLQQLSFDQVRESLPFTDGEYDLVNYAQIRAIHGELSRHFESSINGSFGEVARGYWWELLLPRIGARRPLDAHKVAQRRYAAQSFDASIFPSEKRLDLVAHFTGVIDRTNAGLLDTPNTFQMDHAYLMMRMQRWQGRIASSTNQLWPCLSPFMFRSVLETILETRAWLRWRSLLIRKMLAKFSPRMAAYPLEHGFPAQPATWRNIHRFFPLATYFGKKCVAKVEERLGSRRGARSREESFVPRLQLWKDDRVREILRPPNMRLSGGMDLDGLGNFLQRSQEEQFSFNDQWARLLSLECAFRATASTGRRRG
jgi:hypothetical protein